MRVLVTGGAGQLGVDVRKVCEAAGDDVVACGHADLDVGDRDQTLQVIGAVAPDVVVNCATWTNVDGCELQPARAYLVNALGARNVAEGARLVGGRVVHVSTDYVFDGRGAGPTGGRPYTEWDATAPVSHYGRSKLGGEREIVDLLGPDATVVRTAWLCGAHGGNFVKTMLRMAADPDRDRVTVVDDQRGSPSFTPDVAATIRRLAVERLPGLFHVTNTGTTTWFGLAQAVFRLAGHDAGRVVPITTDELQPPRPAPRPAFSVLDNAALRGLGLPALPDYEPSLADLVRELT